MANWYYGENGEQQGPFDDATIRQAISDGKLTPYTMVWREGMPGWLPLLQVPELSGGGMVSDQMANVPPQYAAPYGTIPGTTSGLAIASMVCGIVGVMMSCCYVSGLFGIPAVICGHMALNRIGQSPIPLAGRGMAITGLILGYLGIVISAGTIVFATIAFSGAALHP